MATDNVRRKVKALLQKLFYDNSIITDDSLLSDVDDIIEDYLDIILSPAAGNTPITQVSTTYTVLSTDYTIECDGTFTVTLPDPDDVTPQIFNIKNVGDGAITVTAGAVITIDGGESIILSPKDNLTVQASDNYIIL